MKTMSLEIENKIDQLLDVLNSDIVFTRKTLQRLDQLRGLVIKRDDTGLSEILAQIQSESSDHNSNELKRKSICRDLAAAMNCPVNQLTLTKLQAQLSGNLKDRVLQTKTTLQALSLELKKQYSSTAMLLTECARLNRMLLKNIFDFSQHGTVTYNTKGSAERQQSSAFVNMKF